MNISLSSVLLFVLIIPFIMHYRLGPGETPYWLFSLILLDLFSNFVADLLDRKKFNYNLVKNILLWFLVATVLSTAFISEIIVRHQTVPTYNVHDGLIQQEAAMRFLLDGVNPYATDYLDTPLKDWHYSDTEINPALYHLVYLPFYIVFALPFYFVSNILFGFFDGRIPLLFLFFVILINSFILVKDDENKRLFVTLLAFNPALLSYTLEGRSDVFMFAFLFIALYFLQKHRIFVSVIAMAFAFSIKQSVWFIFPFYLAYLYFKTKNTVKTLQALGLFVVITGFVIGPFLIWDPKAFIDSTILYLSGSVTPNYPISGYGFGMLLHQLGFIKEVQSYYPFIIWQVIICIPLIFIFIKYLRTNLSVRNLIIIYGIFLFTYWYFSRFMNNSHFGYLSMVFITAYFWPTLKDKT